MLTVVGPYEIIREIARGGMAEVYEAQHPILGRRVALKVQRCEQTSAAAAERMTQEAQILEVLGHLGTVHVFDAGSLDDGRTWIAMELIHGESLADRLARVGRLSVSATIAVFHDVLDVLAAAHEHTIVHRDLKPENLIIDDRGRCRVLDWGIAGIGGQRDRFARGEMQPGTPHYMAPEQARGEPLDTRCDVYALGVVLFEALTGLPPFDGADDMEVLIQHLTVAPPAVGSRRPDCPTGLARMIDGMLAKAPVDRPTTAELRAGLGELLAAMHDYAAIELIEDDEPSIEIEIDIDALEPLDDDVILLEPDAMVSGPRNRWTPDLTVADGELIERESRRGIAPARRALTTT
jgi:eukaryotic-like serine/threonine-protein kinase